MRRAHDADTETSRLRTTDGALRPGEAGEAVLESLLGVLVVRVELEPGVSVHPVSGRDGSTHWASLDVLWNVLLQMSHWMLWAAWRQSGDSPHHEAEWSFYAALELVDTHSVGLELRSGLLSVLCVDLSLVRGLGSLRVRQRYTGWGEMTDVSTTHVDAIPLV